MNITQHIASIEASVSAIRSTLEARLRYLLWHIDGLNPDDYCLDTPCGGSGLYIVEHGETLIQSREVDGHMEYGPQYYVPVTVLDMSQDDFAKWVADEPIRKAAREAAAKRARALEDQREAEKAAATKAAKLRIFRGEI